MSVTTHEELGFLPTNKAAHCSKRLDSTGLQCCACSTLRHTEMHLTNYREHRMSALKRGSTEALPLLPVVKLMTACPICHHELLS
jgi:hypothetical protein